MFRNEIHQTLQMTFLVHCQTCTKKVRNVVTFYIARSCLGRTKHRKHWFGKQKSREGFLWGSFSNIVGLS